MYGIIMFAYFLALMFIKKDNIFNALFSTLGLAIGIFFIGWIGGVIFGVSATIISIVKIVLAVLCFTRFFVKKK